MDETKVAKASAAPSALLRPLLCAVQRTLATNLLGWMPTGDPVVRCGLDPDVGVVECVEADQRVRYVVLARDGGRAAASRVRVTLRVHVARVRVRHLRVPICRGRKRRARNLAYRTRAEGDGRHHNPRHPFALIRERRTESPRPQFEFEPTSHIPGNETPPTPRPDTVNALVEPSHKLVPQLCATTLVRT